ncbi:phage tail tape measure protein [Carnobacterium sp. PL17RED31]|nr:phage tail tape measure protein [Carnobacterium sp. PL17RED31]
MSELRRIGVRLMAEGVDQYKNDLRTAGQEARTMAQETRLAMAELGNNASATSKFQTELKSLERQYDVQARKLKSLESSQKDFSSNLKVTERNIKSTSDAFSKSKTITDQLEKEYKELGNTMGWNATKTKEAKKAWQESKAETDALGNELSELEKTQANYNKELEKMPGKINSAKISMAEMSNQAQKLTEDYVNAGGRFADTADKMEKTGGKIKSVSSAIGSVGSKLTTSVTVPLVAMGTAAATVGIQFEKQMSRVGAVAGATGSELEAMTEQAKELGASTAFSASEAAQGMENLASAGFDASQIMATMPGVLDLAAVSGGDVALASEAAATAINAFGLEASDSAHIADVFARAAADTNAEVGDMAEAMKYAAPMANTLGLSIEDTAAAIGIMSDAGIKGSQAGTTLRGAFTRLAKPTKQASDAMAELGFNAFDANGKVKPMSQIVTELAGSMQGMTKEQQAQTMATIFGQEAMSGMMALVEAGGGKVDTLSHSLENSAGAADKMAKAMQDNVAGTIEEMMGALETAGIEITEALAPAITAVAENVTELVNSFNELDDETQQTILKFLAFAAATGPLLSGIGKVGNGIGTLYTGGSKLVRMFGKWEAGAKLLGPATSSAGTALTTLAGGASTAAGSSGVGGLATALATTLPWALGVAAVAAGGWAVWKLWGEDAHKAADQTNRFGQALSDNTAQIIDDTNQMSLEMDNAISEMFNSGPEAVNGFQQHLNDFTSQSVEDIRQMTEDMSSEFDKLPENVQKTLEEAEKRNSAQNEKAIGKIEELAGKANEIVSKAIEEGRELTNSELNQIENYYSQMAEIRNNALAEDSTAKSSARKALDNEMYSWSQEQLQTRKKFLQEQTKADSDEYDEQLRILDEALASREISQDEYNTALGELNKGRREQIANTSADMIELMRVFGKSEEGIKNSLEQMGLNYEDGISKLEELSNESVNTMAKVSESMTKEAKEAGNAWNDLVTEMDLGEINDKSKKALAEFAKTEDGWNQLTFIAKNADINDNTREFIVNALQANGEWENLSLEEKLAIVTTKGGAELREALEDAGKWDELEPEEQIFLASTNVDEVIMTVGEAEGKWSVTEFAEKLAKIDTNAPDAEAKVEALYEEWTGLDLTVKDGKIVVVEDGVSEATQLARDYNEEVGKTPSRVDSSFFAKFISEETLDKVKDWHEIITKPSDGESTYYTQTPNIEGNIEEGKQWNETVDNAPAYTQSQIQTDVGNTHENTTSVSEFIRALFGLPESKESNVHTSQNADENNGAVALWNSITDAFKPKVVSAAETSQNASANSPAVERWNQAQNNAKSTSTSAITSTNAPTPTAQVNAWNTAQGGTHSTSTSARTSTNAPTPTSQVNAWNTAQGNTHSTNTRATTSTNASSNTGAVNDWTRSVNNAPSSKKSVFTTIYETVQKFIKGKATGDPSWEGGEVWLGDGGRREPYLMPSGQFGVSGNDWELHNLPRGTRIWPSRQAFRTSVNNNTSLAQYLDALPKFAKGGRIDNAYEGYTGLVGEAGPEIFQIAQGKVSITPISSNDRTKVLEAQTNNGSNVDMSDTNQLLETLISLVAQGQVISMDGRAVGNTIFPYIDETMNNKLNRSSVMGMGGN